MSLIFISKLWLLKNKGNLNLNWIKHIITIFKLIHQIKNSPPLSKILYLNLHTYIKNYKTKNFIKTLHFMQRSIKLCEEIIESTCMEGQGHLGVKMLLYYYLWNFDNNHILYKKIRKFRTPYCTFCLF